MKTSVSLLQVQSVIQQVNNLINRCLMVHDKLDASLRDLSRTGDVQACKAARKHADGQLKELSKELKPLLSILQTSPQAAQILPKVRYAISSQSVMARKFRISLLLFHLLIYCSLLRLLAEHWYSAAAIRIE